MLPELMCWLPQTLHPKSNEQTVIGRSSNKHHVSVVSTTEPNFSFVLGKKGTA